MNPSELHAALGTAELTEYWLGELDERKQAAIEEHLFGCASCTASLQRLVALGAGIRALSRVGGVATVLTPGFVTRLKQSGVRVREYSLQPGGSVFCTIAPDDDLAVAHVHARFEGVSRLDAIMEDADGMQLFRLVDIAFNPGSGEIVFAPRAGDLRSYGKVTQRLRLLSVSATGETQLGEYLFQHSPYRAP